MKFQIAWRRKNTTYLHFGPRMFEDRKEAEELAEGLTIEHPQYDHGVQGCDEDGNHIGDVWFPGEQEKPKIFETRLTGDVVKPDETESLGDATGAILDPRERLQEVQPSPQEPSDTDPERDDTDP